MSRSNLVGLVDWPENPVLLTLTKSGHRVESFLEANLQRAVPVFESIVIYLLVSLARLESF